MMIKEWKLWRRTGQMMLACEQALHLGDIVKSTRARGMREETPFMASPLARAARFAHPNMGACSQAKMMLAVLKREKKTKMTKMRHSILASLKYVGWVCCWFSPLLRDIFLQVLRFSPHLKNQHFQIPIRPGTVHEEPLWGWATYKASLYILIKRLFRLLLQCTGTGHC